MKTIKYIILILFVLTCSISISCKKVTDESKDWGDMSIKEREEARLEEFQLSLKNKEKVNEEQLERKKEEDRKRRIRNKRYEKNIKIDYNNSNIKFKTTTYNFKEILEGKDASYKFMFRNTGSEPLKIIDVKKTWGCTVTGYTKSEIAPGGSGYVSAAVSTRNRSGKLTKSVTVKTNSRKNKQIRLTITGTVNPVLEVPRSVNLGTVSKNDVIRKSVDIKVNKKLRNLKIRVKGIANKPGWVDANVKTIVDGKHYKVNIVIKAKDAFDEQVKRLDDAIKRNPKYAERQRQKLYLRGNITFNTDYKQKNRGYLRLNGIFREPNPFFNKIQQ